MRRPKGVRTGKSVVKRFKVTASGKVLFHGAGRRHLLQGKRPKRRRGLRKASLLGPTDIYRITQNLSATRLPRTQMSATLKPGLLRSGRNLPEDVVANPYEPQAIDWPTEAEIQQISRSLAVIGQAGVRWEEAGDYFNSGDLAYQMREIIRVTAELFRKAQRLQRAHPMASN